MEPLGSPYAAASGVILAVLGARRRARLPEGHDPTLGQQVTTLGRATSAQATRALSGISRLCWGLTASAAEVGGVATAMLIRTTSHVSDRVSSAMFELAGNTAAVAGGLVVDGVASIGDRLQAPLRGAN
jgi:hypothetical protein